MDKKKRILIVVTVIVIVLAILICVLALSRRNNPVNIINNPENEVKEEAIIRKEDDGTKVNISQKIENAKFTIDGLEIKNIKLTELGQMTEIAADVVNNTSSDVGDISLNIILYDKSGEVLTEIGGYIGLAKAGEASKLNAFATLDHSEAYDIKIEKKDK